MSQEGAPWWQCRAPGSGRCRHQVGLRAACLCGGCAQAYGYTSVRMESLSHVLVNDLLLEGSEPPLFASTSFTAAGAAAGASGGGGGGGGSNAAGGGQASSGGAMAAPEAARVVAVGQQVTAA